jgi:TRAP-type C4-dicarboxylate transport system permease small subunit
MSEPTTPTGRSFGERFWSTAFILGMVALFGGLLLVLFAELAVRVWEEWHKTPESTAEGDFYMGIICVVIVAILVISLITSVIGERRAKRERQEEALEQERKKAKEARLALHQKLIRLGLNEEEVKEILE